MDLTKLAFLLGALLCSVSGTTIDGYYKTEGAWILALNRRHYSVDTVAECPTKCDNEASFTCRSFIYIEQDQECWTAGANSKTQTLLRRTSSALYEKSEYLLECVNGIGTDYRGTKARTKSGKTCQRWEAKYPHRPNYTPQTNPLADLEANFCRNPDGDSGGPWCYTTDSGTRWEHCNVPICTEYLLECVNGIGTDYRGTKARTKSGKTCQRWEAKYPHRPNYTPQTNPLADLEANFCRNPDGDSGGPWCYTTDSGTRWEHCNVPSCTGLDNNYCRNPDNERIPWCYTTDSETRWEYCRMPTCGDGAGP